MYGDKCHFQHSAPGQGARLDLGGHPHLLALLLEGGRQSRLAGFF